ncbi:CTR2 short splice variant [Biscogniauxia mediterranea]|nr:CTR2 short splice variant [Biscogniauxia mediterranea]
MDHSHMDHAGMDHGHGGHGDMDHGMPMPMCSMNWRLGVAVIPVALGQAKLSSKPPRSERMLFTWDTTNLCIIFRFWHIRGPASLVFSLLAIVAICAGYEALREGTRRYETWISQAPDAAPNEQVTEDTPFLLAGRSSSREAATISQRARVVKAALLLFMTYNGFVMIAVAVGAGVGYYLFGSHTRATKETACH